MSVAASSAPPARRMWRLGGIELYLGAALFGLLALGALFAPWLETHAPTATDLRLRFAGPGEHGFLLGSDHLGRDMWSRAIAGLSWSMACALAATAIAAVIGVTLGLIAAERPGWARSLVRQTTDTVIAFPGLVVAICVIAVAGQGFLPLTLTLGLLSWPVFARVSFAEAQSLWTRDYVVAARLMGTGRVATLWGHVLPGLRPTLLVITAFHFGDMLIAESALSFLGIGAPVGAPTWGNMLAESRRYLFTAPGTLLVPAAFVATAVIAANLLGDGLAGRSRAAAGAAR